MRQNGNSRDLDMILEENRRARRSAAGRASDGRNTAGRSAGGRSGADVQLWSDDRKDAAFGARYRSREERMRRQREMRRRKRRRQMLIARTVVGVAGLLVILGVAFGLWKLGSFLWNKEDADDALTAMQMQEEQQLIEENEAPRPAIEEKFLTPNEYSRPGEPLPEVTELFVHYTANAGTSAAQNRSYFENLGITGETSASAHFVIGFDGEIIQCLPLDEIGYAVKEHNYNSISIECCYLQEDGKFEDATYQSLIELLGWLMNEYDLGPSAIKRHYDSSGKLCPKYYVEHEDAWEQLKKDVEAYIS